jgi:hypothetical protein
MSIGHALETFLSDSLERLYGWAVFGLGNREVEGLAVNIGEFVLHQIGEECLSESAALFLRFFRASQAS